MDPTSCAIQVCEDSILRIEVKVDDIVGTYNYFAPIYQRNHEPPVRYNNSYTTDLLWNKSLGFLDDARQAGDPFFLTMAAVAPHGGIGRYPPHTPHYGAVPKEEYSQLFTHVKVLRTKNFNFDTVRLSRTRLRSPLNLLSLAEPAGYLSFHGSTRARLQPTRALQHDDRHGSQE